MKLEQGSHLGVGRVLQGADLSAPGVVDQDIEAAMALHRLADDRGVPGRVGHVQRDREELAGVGALEIGEGGAAAAPQRCRPGTGPLRSEPARSLTWRQ